MPEGNQHRTKYQRKANRQDRLQYQEEQQFAHSESEVSSDEYGDVEPTNQGYREQHADIEGVLDDVEGVVHGFLIAESAHEVEQCVHGCYIGGKSSGKKENQYLPGVESALLSRRASAVAGRVIEKAPGEEEKQGEGGCKSDPVEQGAGLTSLRGQGRHTGGVLHEHGDQTMVIMIESSGAAGGEHRWLHPVEAGETPQDQLGALILKSGNKLLAKTDTFLGPSELLEAEGCSVQDMFLAGKLPIQALEEVERRFEFAPIKERVGFQKYFFCFRFVHARAGVPIDLSQQHSIVDREGGARQQHQNPSCKSSTKISGRAQNPPVQMRMGLR